MTFSKEKNKIKKAFNTTRKTSSCGRPIAAGAKTAAICRLLRHIFGPPLYMRSIAAFFVTAAIGRVFCGILQRQDIKPPQQTCFSGGNRAIAALQKPRRNRDPFCGGLDRRNRPLNFPTLKFFFIFFAFLIKDQLVNYIRFA